MNRLISIIRAVLHGEKISVKIDEKLLALASYHSLAPFLYPCMDGEQTEKRVFDKVTEIYYTAIKRDVIQSSEREALEADFERANIPYLALKGMVMKSFYPQTHLRTMGDLDYLVEPCNFDSARKIICEHGYKFEGNSEHHLEYVKPPIMVVELHRMLIAKDEMGRGLLEDVVSRCKVKDGACRLEMSDEDFYLYLMLHLLKHYVRGGTGLRSFIDIYLYLKSKPDLDREYLNSAFAKTEYSQTISLIERFSCDLFDGNPLDDQEEEMFGRVMQSGTYGTIENMSDAELKKSGNSAIKIIFRRVFPTVKAMKGFYPVLSKGAGIMLLPIFYVWHAITRLFSANSYRRVRELILAKKRNGSKKEE
ncbi:MAG: nucleotidyltransferase family protein [Candidatus Coproplasma sp.]